MNTNEMAIELAKVIYDKLGPSEVEKLTKEVLAMKFSTSYTGLWGALDNYWLVDWKFNTQYTDEKYSENDSLLLPIWSEIAKYCFWVYTFEEYCFVCDRPNTFSIDENKLLHSETGPAIGFDDGYRVYSWHGEYVHEDWIINKGKAGVFDASIALGQRNTERRRVACEILGWNTVLEDPSLSPRIIDKDTDDIGTLIEVDLPDAPNQRFIKFKCGTGRWFAEPVVDYAYDTALKANAGGNGWRGVGDPWNYIPMIRT